MFPSYLSGNDTKNRAGGGAGGKGLLVLVQNTHTL